MTEQRELRPRVQCDYHDMISCDELLLDKFSIRDKLKEPRYAVHSQQDGGSKLVEHLPNGKGLSVKNLQSHGFTHPIVIHKSTGLGLRMPPASFSVDDVRRLIGPQRKVDAMNCETQQAVTMSLDQFCSYYQCSSGSKQQSSGGRRGALNVISLEFSHTPLDPLVEPPALVRELDWVSTVWPTDLINKQSDPTNDMRKMMYPKVRKYCLMSVGGCYTDFHVDFGGTSVWYHIIKGEKIFILIPPSSRNYDLFVKWHGETFQEAIFFADEVDECEVVRLKAGDTLLMPSGWIHAVYTPKDSLVFGGNFLNCFNISQQLEVAMLEDKLKVKSKFLFPLYSHIHWYLVYELHELLNTLEAHVDKMTTTQEIALPPYHTWLKAVSVKKLSRNDYKKLGVKFSKEKENKRKDRKVKTEKEVTGKNSYLPYLSQIEKDGFLLLVKKMKNEKLFSEDVPSRIYHPRILLERLEAQLTSAQLSMLFSQEINGVTVLHHVGGGSIPNSPCSIASPTLLETNKGNTVEHKFTALQPSLPEIIRQPSAAIVQPSLPHLPETLKQSSTTTTQSSLPETSSHSAIIARPSSPLTSIVLQSSTSATSEQPLLPATSDQSSLPATNELSAIINEQPLVPVSKEQSDDNQPLATNEQPASIEQLLLLATSNDLPSLPMTNEQPSSLLTSEQPLPPMTIEQLLLLASSDDQSTLPVTNENLSLPSTNEQLSLPAIIDQLLLPTINEDPLSLPKTTEQPLSLPVTIAQPSSLPSTIAQPLSLPATTEQPSSLPSTIAQPLSLPVTIAQPSSLPATIAQPLSLPATIAQPSSLPSTIAQPLSLPSTIAQPPSLPSTIAQPSSLPVTTTKPLSTVAQLPAPIAPPMTAQHKKVLSSHSLKQTKRAQSSRRKRCGVCEGCTRLPCGYCKFCLDSPQRGGEGKLKQACLHRKCTALMAPFLPSFSSSSFTCERRPADSTTPDTVSPTLPQSFKLTVPVPTKAGGDKKPPLSISLFDTYENEKEKVESDERKEDIFSASLLESSLFSNPHKPLSPSSDDTDIDLLPVAKRSRPSDHEDPICSALESDPLLSSINSLPPNTLQLLSSISLASLLPISLSSHNSVEGSSDFALQLPGEEQLPVHSQSSLLDEMVSAAEQINSDSV